MADKLVAWVISIGVLVSARSVAAGINTCAGTSDGFSMQTNESERYASYRAMYTGCHYVLGNLEINMSPGTQKLTDFSFLADIVEVKGYVLILLTKMASLPLRQLAIVRGEKVLEYSSNERTIYFSFLINMNENLHYLELSALKEISNGNVGFVKNKALSCHATSLVNWQYIFAMGSQEVNVVPFTGQVTVCPPSVRCNSTCGNSSHCWGPSGAACQQVTNCSSQCAVGVSSGKPRPRCFGPERDQCCNSQCAGSCVGPYDTDCLACRNFRNDDQCVPSCPDPLIYDPLQFKFSDNPNKRYTLGSLCVKKCPGSYAIFNGFCILSCPSGYTENMTTSICEKCVGPCPKKCNVTLIRDESITSERIRTLVNCTEITGNLNIAESDFVYNVYTNVPGLTADDLSILSTVKRVTGYVRIEASSVPWLTDFSFLRNLEEIRGTELVSGRYSLILSAFNADYLGLSSLKKIHAGGVLVTIKRQHCYTDRTALTSIINSPSFKAIIDNNCTTACDAQCKDRHCWGPGASMCLKCASYISADGSTCVASCKNGEYTPPRVAGSDEGGRACQRCNEECKVEQGCSGPMPNDCTACLNYRDGPYCVSKCPNEKYPDESKICQPCHAYCKEGCSGPLALVGKGGCSKCFKASVLVNGTVHRCISKSADCPLDQFATRSLPLASQSAEHPDTEFCVPCKSQCETCRFYGGCTTCKNVSVGSIGDNDEQGGWDGSVKCASSCPLLHYEKLVAVTDSRGVFKMQRTCLPCYKLCIKGCHGPSASHCEQCDFARLYDNTTLQLGNFTQRPFTCVSECPPWLPFLYDDPEGHDACFDTELKLGALTDEAKKNVPGIIGGAIGAFVVVLGIVLVIAFVCRQRAASREKSRRYEAKLLGVAISAESLNLTGAPPDLARLRLVKESEIRRGCVIGSGAFGTVYKGIWMPEGEGVTIPVAIKVLQEGTSPETNKELLEEARVMASVQHLCCVRILAVCLTAPMMLLTQLMPLGCLLDYVRKNKSNIGSKILLDWCTQIAQGMEYLEGRGIVHRDLAARNVLVQSTSQVKITDFGLAKVLDYMAEQYEATSGKMPIKWMALESIQHRTFTHKSDVWSYGVTVWELFTYGQRPYDGVRAYDMPYTLEKGERLSQPSICTIDVYLVMIKCWMLDAGSRPTFTELVTEFGRMSKDPGRYLVIAGDRLMKLASVTYSARDMLGDDLALAAEEATTVLDADEYLMPTSIASNTSNTSDGSTSALDEAVKTRPAYPVGKGRASSPSTSHGAVESRYGPAPVKLAAAEELDESAGERQPFLAAHVDESGYLQPQQCAIIEDYLSPQAPAGQSGYLDIIPEDDVGGIPKETPQPPIENRPSAAPRPSKVAGTRSHEIETNETAADKGDVVRITDADNPAYYMPNSSRGAGSSTGKEKVPSVRYENTSSIIDPRGEGAVAMHT